MTTADDVPTSVISRRHVGVFRFTGGMQPFASVERVWDQTIESLERHFRVTVHRSADLDLRRSRSAARLLDAVDLAVLLLPYQQVPAERRPPLLVLALGSLHKGASWLAAHRSQFRSTDTVIVNSDACVKIFREIVQGESLGVELVPLGIDLRAFHPRPRSAEMRRHLGIPPDARVLVYSGRVSLQKNVQVVLAVLSRLRRAALDVRLLMIGDADDFVIPEVCGPPTASFDAVITAEIGRLGVSQYVHRSAHVSQHDLASVLAVADAGINLSTFPNENFGLAVVEMQACGLPVVVSDWGGHRDTTRHGRSSWHVPTMLSELGPRLSMRVAEAQTSKVLGLAGRGTSGGDAAVESARRYSLDRFDASLRSAVERAILRPALNRARAVAVNPTWHDAMMQQLDVDGDLRWTELNALDAPRLYRSILRHAATFTPEDVDWTTARRVDRTFDWHVDGDGELRCSDPRWSACALTAIERLSASEREVMRLVMQTSSVRRIVDHHGAHATLSALEALTRTGFVMPPWSLRRAQQATRARPRSDPARP